MDSSTNKEIKLKKKIKRNNLVKQLMLQGSMNLTNEEYRINHKEKLRNELVKVEPKKIIKF